MKVNGRGGNLTPAIQPTQPMVTKICVSDYVGDIYHHTKFYPNRFRGFGSAHAWFRAPRHKVTRLLFSFLEKGYSRDACTDFDAKYVKRRDSAQGSAFWGSRNQNLRFYTPLPSPKKPPFLGPISTGLRIFSPEKCFNIGRLESKRTLIVVVAQ